MKPIDIIFSQQCTGLDLLGNQNMLKWVEDIKDENNCLKKALATAEQLIGIYQKENQFLKNENMKMNKIVHETESQCNNLRKQNTQFNEQARKETLFQQHQADDKKEINCLRNKIEQLISIQETYESKIIDMDHAIKLLEGNQNKNRLNKQQYSVNVAFLNSNNNPHMTSIQSQFCREPKNISELRNLHTKIKKKQTEETVLAEKLKNSGSIVERVFSKQKTRNCTSVNSLNSRKNKQNSAKIKK